ncbi:MAG: helix-turn-helix domain-containing protein [Chloroflexi bacterium]|uniref:Helix-turn-helix domain-containing protein n=1 Tax=Candidatus Chlorohelix allophototropha TaxID=3003348 RepID=A0A8T7LWS2_9CHLR|nr:helix-turn-helix domain-containing protein [Chloroflexota bacterium]WJW65782.1 helix-turn-helix domain-containing protein [Chloroflexota bacterium L227-S17]
MTKEAGFFIVDNEVLDNYGSRIGAYGIAVYNALCRFANSDGECFPSYQAIMERTGMGRSSVINSLAKLEEVGLIEAQDRPGHSKVYTVLPLLKRAIAKKHPSTTQTPTRLSHKPDPSATQTLIRPNEKTQLTRQLDHLPQPDPVWSAIENCIGFLPSVIVPDIEEALGKYPREWILEATKEAASNNKRKWAYISAILKSWAEHGFKVKWWEANKPVVEQPVAPADYPKELGTFRPGKDDNPDFLQAQIEGLKEAGALPDQLERVQAKLKWAKEKAYAIRS